MDQLFDVIDSLDFDNIVIVTGNENYPFSTLLRFFTVYQACLGGSIKEEGGGL